MWMRPAATDAETTTASTAGPDTPGPLAAGALPAIAGGSQELDKEPAGAVAAAGTLAARSPRTQPEVAFVAVLAGAATIFFGVIPQPLFNLVHGVGSALGLL
jgi:hypothetical protein